MVCKKHWANSGLVQHLLFCHWSTPVSLFTLWSSEEFIHLFSCLGLRDTSSVPLLYCRKYSSSTNTVALRKKAMVSPAIHKVLYESKSNIKDKTKNLPPQCTNTFARQTSKACCVPGTPFSKSLGKSEQRWGISSITWQRKLGLS